MFSAGAVFYYMLSGVKPFSAPDLPAVLHRVNSEDPPPLTAERCPPGLWRILMKALAKQTSERYADMGQLLADLVRYEQDFDTETRAMASATRQRAAEVSALVALRNQLSARAGQSAPAAVSPFSDQLLDRYPVLDERGGDALGVVPFRRAALAEISADLDARRLVAQRRDLASEAAGGGHVSRRLVLDDGRSQRELVLRERMTVGRDPGCDISDSDPRLSRRHAEFLATASGLVVRDLESRNGVRVNGADGARSHAVAGRPGGDCPSGECGSSTTAPPSRPASPCRRPVPAPVEGVQVREGFEDDRTRVLPVPQAVGRPSPGPSSSSASRSRSRSATPAMSPSRRWKGTVRVALPRNAALARSVAAPAATGRAGPDDDRLGLARAGPGRVAGRNRVSDGHASHAQLADVDGRAIGAGLLVRMLAAPLLASLFVGLDRGLADRADDGARAGAR